jgi:uncharacterized membrane protein YfcA
MSEPVVRTAAPAKPVNVAAIAVVGAVAGFLAGLFGVGGGILIVPGLVLVAGMDQRLAHGTSLAAVLPIAVASLLAYTAHDHVDWPAALWLSVGAVAGAVIGTRLLHVLPVRVLAGLFAGIVLASAVRLFFATDAEGRSALSVGGIVALVAVGLVAGIVAGLFGVGGGILLVPAMILLIGIPPVVAKGTSAAVIVPAAVMGTWRNRRRANADLRAAAIVGAAGIVTAALGGTIAGTMSDQLSNVLFASLLVVVAGRLLWQLQRERMTARPSYSSGGGAGGA